MVRRGKKFNFQRGSYRQFKTPNIFKPAKNYGQKKANIKFPLHLWKVFLAIITLLFLLYLVFFSSVFNISDVFVEGNHFVESDKVKELVAPGQNIFRFDQNIYKQKLKAAFPEIQDTQIFRGIPNAIKIVLLEHEAKIIWQSGESKYLVSSQGEVIKKVDAGEGYPVVIDARSFPVNVGDAVVSPSFIAFIINIKDNFFSATNIQPTTFEIQSTTFDVNLHTEAGFYVKLNSLRASRKQLDNLRTVLAQKRQDIHEYIDLRIDGWAYYK